MENLNGVFFFPWVGSQYCTGGVFRKKIMVLGDSHYCGEDCKACGADFKCDCNHFTTKVLNDYLDQSNEREGWMSTYLKFERSLVNHETTPEESLKIWNSLLFYNYLQIAMQGPRQAGTVEQYQAASAPFFEVMNKYQPDMLVVWGKRLWANLPNECWIDGGGRVVDGYTVDDGYYQLPNGKKVYAICVYHPSVGYSWDYWYKAIMMG